MRVCCHSNETRALIANPPNSAQLEGTPYHSQVTSGSVQLCGNAARDRQTHTRTDRHTDDRGQYTFASAMLDAKWNNSTRRLQYSNKF